MDLNNVIWIIILLSVLLACLVGLALDMREKVIEKQ